MPTSARRTVLYVEDHPVNALLMAALFERRPALALVIAASGAEALRRAAAQPLDLLLLDLGLPDMHGSTLLTQLRALPGCAGAPAVAVTADVHFAALERGFCELWPKPLCVDDVLARLDALTGTVPSAPPQLPREWFAGATASAPPALLKAAGRQRSVSGRGAVDDAVHQVQLAHRQP